MDSASLPESRHTVSPSAPNDNGLLQLFFCGCRKYFVYRKISYTRYCPPPCVKCSSIFVCQCLICWGDYWIFVWMCYKLECQGKRQLTCGSWSELQTNMPGDGNWSNLIPELSRIQRPIKRPFCDRLCFSTALQHVILVVLYTNIEVIILIII